MIKTINIPSEEDLTTWLKVHGHCIEIIHMRSQITFKYGTTEGCPGPLRTTEERDGNEFYIVYREK